jgi:hypothetical protein
MSLASFSSDSLTHDRLFAGPSSNIHSRKVTLLSGQNLTRGTVLGKKVTAGTIAGAADAGNTGNGAIGTLSVGTGAQLGVYRAVCIEPGTNLGTFAVFDPYGVEVGRAIVGSAFTGQVNFTIADGATDFVAGDAFSITVSAVTEKYLKSLAAATDGSQVPDAVLAEDCDASGGDAEALAYDRGDFAESALTLGTGHTVDSIREGLRVKGITLVKTQGA